MRLVDLPVEGLRGEKHGLVLTDTDERELRLQVGQGNVSPDRRDVGESLAVGVPDWLVVGPGVGGDPDRLLLPVGEVRLHQPDVGVVVGVGLFGPVADEGDHAPIRRPGRIGVLVVPGGDLREGLGLDVEDVEMGAQTIQITHIVFLEQQPVDHPGPGGLSLARLRIADHEHESLPVGRPLVGLDSLLDTGERDPLAAAQVQRVDLLALRAPFPFTVRQERQVLAIRAPPGPRCGAPPSRHGDRLAAGVGDHPQPRLVLVCLELLRMDGEGDPGTIWADARVVYVLQGKVVIDLEMAVRIGILRQVPCLRARAYQKRHHDCQ